MINSAPEPSEIREELPAVVTSFEQLGFAPAVTGATEAGSLRRVDYSEVMFISGLRALLAGLPFLPTRAGIGSQVTANAGIRMVTCPYTGDQLLTARALRPDVSVLHSAAADREANVLGPEQADFLFDMDANLARASRRVIVTVEALVDTADKLAVIGAPCSTASRWTWWWCCPAARDRLHCRGITPLPSRACRAICRRLDRTPRRRLRH